MNVFVKGLPKDLTTEQLDKMCTEQFGNVKSAKISRSVATIEKTENNRKIKILDPKATPVSNGYGFVCFQNKEDAEKAVEKAKVDGSEIIRYQPRDPREIRRVYNNIYVKNFNPEWN
jgi:RNA recognition motif-containing protein